ncbi:MAG: DEAD/DEAH box helicase [Nitriliruptorales bacterium]|nr:DEAD/DEAH box helicase [Nitriliruptorales bacterium]
MPTHNAPGQTHHRVGLPARTAQRPARRGAPHDHVARRTARRTISTTDAPKELADLVKDLEAEDDRLTSLELTDLEPADEPAALSDEDFRELTEARVFGVPEDVEPDFEALFGGSANGEDDASGSGREAGSGRTDYFVDLAQAHLDGLASDDDLEELEEHEDEWIEALQVLKARLRGTIANLEGSVRGPERELVLADFGEELRRIDIMLAELTGTAPPEPAKTSTAAEVLPELPPLSDPQIQLSWGDGRVIAWASGAYANSLPGDELVELLTEAGSSADAWETHAPIALPDDRKADAVSAPLASVLGWLVSVGAASGDDADGPDVDFGVSAHWLGLVAALGVRLVAQGRMVPQLDRSKDPDNKTKGDNERSMFAVHWVPTLIDEDELASLAHSMPGAVTAPNGKNGKNGNGKKNNTALTRTILGACVDAICRDAASHLAVPAPPPRPRTGAEVAETFLARLDGTAFDAPDKHATGLSHGLRRWAEPVIGQTKLKLTVRLDPPDDMDAWHLKTFAPIGKGRIDQVEPAMSKASNNRREAIKAELERLETLYPPLAADRSKHRGEVLLSQDEAWEFMTDTGQDLVAAGFEVQVPPIEKKSKSPGLKVTSTGAGERGQTQVGANDLANVHWTAVVGDVELTAEDLRELSEQSRPLVKAHGKWVPVSHADLEKAAEALRERQEQQRLTGAQMLRYALGLETGPLAGGVVVDGEGWAMDLWRSAQDIPEQPTTTPEGFSGELRKYQADALAWLDFLDSAGLGGCLALDMGLGKTPVMLAHLQLTTHRGPHLVIAPPAVVGNWASEAKRFVPDLDVVVHHGAGRAEDLREIRDELSDADVLITTYGTALRDIGELEEIDWGKVVLDEAQVIKNHTTETAQALRRLNAHAKAVLTGTPIENGLGDLWSLMDFVNPGLVGDRSSFITQLSADNGHDSAEHVLRTLNGVLVFRRTKAEPVIAQELPDRIDELDHCPMTKEQIGLYQAVLDELVVDTSSDDGSPKKKGAVLAAITALKQICNHPAAYTGDDEPLEGRSGKLERLEEIIDNVFANDERMLIFTHFATWGERLAGYLTEKTGTQIRCYHGGLARGARDKMIKEFQAGKGAGALVLSLKAGGTGLNLTAASHVVLYDRWWNPAVEDQARDRAWRIGQDKTVVAHRLVVPGTVDERVEEVVQGKRKIADMVLPKSSSVSDLDSDQLQKALGINPDQMLTADEIDEEGGS